MGRGRQEIWGHLHRPFVFFESWRDGRGIEDAVAGIKANFRQNPPPSPPDLQYPAKTAEQLAHIK